MKSPRWSTLRALVQLALWGAFLLFIVTLRFPVENEGAYTLVPRLSPHLALAASLSARETLTVFYPAMIVLILTLVFGRFFCGWICPLGITLDGTDRMVKTGGNHPQTGKSGEKDLRYGKYLVLTGSLILALAGFQAAGLIDPLSLVVRSYGLVVYPYLDFSLKGIFQALGHIPGVSHASEPLFSLLKGSLLDLNPILFSGHITVLLFFLVLLLLSRMARRFWCRSLCPLGAVLALTSRFSFFRRKVSVEKCTHCLKCQRDCRMGAIEGKGLATREEECIKCFECLQSCSYDAISFGFGNPFAKEQAVPREEGDDKAEPEISPGGLTRKRLLAGVVSSAALVPVLKINAEYRADFSHLIRPPGALREEDFLDRCIRCGECMKACPTNGLHPTLLEAGVEGLFTPRLIPRLGWCEKNCNLCTLVCPTGALKRLELADRETTVIGTAYFIHDLCIPWSENRECLVCEEMCPTQTKSIRFREETVLDRKNRTVRIKRPYVVEDICIGCGICENKCPVPGSAAIRVRTPKNVPLSALTSQKGEGGYGGE